MAAIGAGLRALHDALPVVRLVGWERLRQAGAHRLGAPAKPPPEPPPIDRLGVCHGDACAPNTLIDDQGSWTGHVDIGELGVADRWADLAIATWSTEWNYGPSWDGELLHAYGIERDPVRTA